MIYRFMFCAYNKTGNLKVLPNESISHLSVCRFRDMVFIYFESRNHSVNPDEVVSGDFIPFPDGQLFFRMSEVFHYSKPLSDQHWARKIKNKQGRMDVIFLDPEKIQSYFFYHYQYQEEKPGDGDKYGIIFIYKNLLVFYLEDPCEPETEDYCGALKTNNSPNGHEWSKLMSQHFLKWQDYNGEWRTIEKIL
ncbi:MAG: hypothetical protein Q4B04_03305 [bacterium]|nr:hypothetical protein [bacterium]